MFIACLPFNPTIIRKFEKSYSTNMKQGEITLKRCQALDGVKLAPNIIGGLKMADLNQFSGQEQEK